jgi:hypothetical protein
MTSSNDDLYGHFPKSIPFPRIERPHRAGCGGLAGVRKASDLPSRLIFGDLDESSFKASAEGWHATYRDVSGNGLELSVTGRRFSAKPTFLGTTGLSCGPVDPPRAFGELLNLGASQWNAKLAEYLEARHPVTVPELDARQPCVLYIPDGWLGTILVPVAPARLSELLEWHLSLIDDPGISAALTGSVALAFNSVNYIEGRWQGELDPDYLAFRSLDMTRTPLAGPVLRESGKDGSHALTLRRVAYVYRCTAFLRDIPFVVASLHGAGFLPSESDLRATVLPAELALAAESMSWFPPARDCRITWAWLDNPATSLLADCGATAASARKLVLAAREAASEFEEATGLRAILVSGDSEGSRS